MPVVERAAKQPWLTLRRDTATTSCFEMVFINYNNAIKIERFAADGQQNKYGKVSQKGSNFKQNYFHLDSTPLILAFFDTEELRDDRRIMV